MTQMTLDRDHPLLESIRGIKVLDVDTHLTEPGDLWTSRAPAKYRDLVPRVEFVTGEWETDVMGRKFSGTKPVWVVGDGVEMGYAGGASVINKENIKIRGSEFIQWPLTEVSAAASYVKPRLEMLDEVGIWGQVVYPNAVGFGGQNFFKIPDPELRLLCLTIWNDAMAEMQEESGQRLFGMAMLPWWDRDAAIREIERAHHMGIKGVNMTSDPQQHGLPDLSDPYYQPMWEALTGLDMPVNFHIGAAVSVASYMGPAPWPSLDNDQKLAMGTMLLFLSNARVIGNFIYSGVLDRNPALKIVSVESGIGWVPFVLRALDYQAEECKVDNLSMRPSEYFKRQIFGCFWFEEGEKLLQDVEGLGVDNCMFETDFPHPTCLYPQPLNGIAKTFSDHKVDFEVRKKLLSGNAARVYNIDLPED
jgi:predicted TIM-barrel fold metal-dependent hydrolase